MPRLPLDTCAPPSTSPGWHRGLWGISLLIAAFWMAIHPYLGIVHDGMLYTLLSLARLFPSLGHDFFVAYGAQDHYTLFGPLYAEAIRLLGLNLAAALLVAITQGVFLYAAWRLVRCVTRVDQALLGLGLLVVLPSWYGANMAFYHLEMFPTPRQPAESLVLLGLSFAIPARRRAAALCLVAAALLHPIIAGAGILFWILLEFALPHPRAAILTGLICMGLGVLAVALPHSPIPRFDPDWLNDLTHRQPYLFPSLWSAQDWARSAPGLATLLVGALRAENPGLRRLCLAALITVLAGLALAVIGADLLHVTFATQLQTWRWLWLSGVLSGLLLPVAVMDAWKSGLAGRASALALTACWLTAQPFVVFAAIAVACLSALPKIDRQTPVRWVLMLAAGAVLAASAGFLMLDWHHLLDRIQAMPPSGSHLATRIGQLRLLASSAPLCAIVLTLLWQAARRATVNNGTALILLGTMACVAMLPYAWATWTREGYRPEAAARFESWRQIIPENAEVLWPDSPPLDLWYSLLRSSWFSPVQMAGIVFSRHAWEIGHQRETAVLGYLPLLGGLITGAPAGTTEAMNPRFVFDNICRAKGIGYFASWRDLGPSPYPVLNQTQPSTGKPAPLRLYHCDSGPRSN